MNASNRWSNRCLTLGTLVILFGTLLPPSAYALEPWTGSVYVGGGSCLGAGAGFIESIQVDVGRTGDITVEDVCNFLGTNNGDPGSAPSPGGPGPSPMEICRALNGRWVSGECVLSDSMKCVLRGGRWDSDQKKCIYPKPPIPEPCGGCPTCPQHGPWDVMMAGLPGRDGKIKSDIVLVVKRGAAGKRRLFTLRESSGPKPR